MKLIQIALVCGACMAAFAACSSDDTGGVAGSAGAAGAAGSAAGGAAGSSAGAAGAQQDGGLPEAGEDAQPEGGAKLTATIDTSKGKIVIELYADKAPITVDNFKKYADESLYNGTVFHRVIKGFMIQGGGYDENFNPIANYDPIVNEAISSGLSNLAGTIAMARTSDPNSATSEFFINAVDNKFLDPGGSPQNPDGYAVFGMVTEGMDVVQTIENVATQKVGMNENVPVEPVFINSVVVQ